VIQRKLQVVSDFLDILIARRIWNFRSIDYSTTQYAMFLAVKEIRGLDVDRLAAVLMEGCRSWRTKHLATVSICTGPTGNRFIVCLRGGRLFYTVVFLMSGCCRSGSLT